MSDIAASSTVWYRISHRKLFPPPITSKKETESVSYNWKDANCNPAEEKRFSLITHLNSCVMKEKQMKMDIEEQQRFYLDRKNLFCSQFTLYVEHRISTIQIKVLGCLHFTPRGAAWSQKPMKWSSRHTVYMLILMPEEDLDSYRASRAFATILLSSQRPCSVTLHAHFMTGWLAVIPKNFHFAQYPYRVDLRKENCCSGGMLLQHHPWTKRAL